MNTIVLTGGGTAGHVMTHIAILSKLKNKFDKVCYLGSNGIEKSLMNGLTEFYEIPTVKYNRKLDFHNLLIPFKLRESVKQAKSILQKIKPNVIFSKGGYVSLPVMLAGKSLNIPLITHESDLTLGLTNKIMAKKCDMVLTTFEETAKKLDNGVFVGSPIRDELFSANKKDGLRFFGLSPNKPVLLVFGGSIGSQKINLALNGALIELLKDFQVLHVCGKGNMNSNANVDGYKQFEYINDMSKAYGACDICVSRAGSNSCGELMALKIPTLFIPLSKAVSRGDQIENANYFFNRKMCKVLQEENLSSDSLLTEIRQLYKDKDNIISAINRYKHTYANDNIIKILSRYNF